MCFPTSVNLSSCHALWTLESISLSRCHVSIPSHRHLMQISDRVSACYWLTLTSLLSSPPMLSCSPGQATGPTEQRSSAESWPACGLGCSHTILRRERGDTIRSVSSNFRAFSYEQISITTVSTWVHSTCWDWSSMIQYDHLLIRISQLVEILNKTKIVLDLCTALMAWVSWVRVMRLIITVVSVTVRSLWNIKGPCCPYRETRKYFLYLWTIWVFRLAALVSLRGREEISLTCLEMLQMPAKTQHNKLAMF